MKSYSYLAGALVSAPLLPAYLSAQAPNGAKLAAA